MTYIMTLAQCIVFIVRAYESKHRTDAAWILLLPKSTLQKESTLQSSICRANNYSTAMASKTSTLKCAAILVMGTLLMICLFASGAAADNGDNNNPANPPPSGANPPRASKDHVPGTKTNAGDNSGNTHRNAADGAFVSVWGLLGSAVMLLFTLF